MTSNQVAFIILVLAKFEILDHCIHFSRNQGKIKKSTPLKKPLLDMPEGGNLISKLVGMLSPMTKTNNGNLLRKLLNLGQCKIQKNVGTCKHPFLALEIPQC